MISKKYSITVTPQSWSGVIETDTIW